MPPELNKPRLGIPLPFLKGTFYYRLILPNQIVMLTDHEFIQVQESGSPNRINSYGSIWIFSPLRMVEQVEILTDVEGYLAFVIRFKNGYKVVSKYPSSRKAELENLKEMIDSLI